MGDNKTPAYVIKQGLGKSINIIRWCQRCLTVFVITYFTSKFTVKRFASIEMLCARLKRPDNSYRQIINI